MTYKAVIFDLDGTLVNSLEDIADSMNLVLKTLDLKAHDLEDYKYFIGNGIRNLVSRALPEESREETFITECFDSMMKEYRKRCLEKTRPYEGIPELLDELTKHKLKLCVLSNKVDELTRKVVAALLANWKFEVVLGPREDIPRKPDPTGALYISKNLNIPQTEIIYLGDSGVDMQTAAAAKMYGVGALWGYRGREELSQNGAQRLINYPLEFLELL